MFDQKNYQEWNEKRINFLLTRFTKDFFKNKTILELGCGYGFIGNQFYETGAKVWCCDVRQENVNKGKELFPHLIFSQINLNSEEPFPGLEFDIIIHFGTLYHLSCDLEKHLLKMLSKTKKYMFLETEVSDSFDEKYNLSVKESTDQDQSIDGQGQRPSPAMIEKIFDENNIKYNRCIDVELDCEVGYYSWEPQNTGDWIRKRPNGQIKDGQRCFWIIKK